MQYHAYFCTRIRSNKEWTKHWVAVREEVDLEVCNPDELKEKMPKAYHIDVMLAKDPAGIKYAFGKNRHDRVVKAKLDGVEFILVRNVNECDRCAGTGIYPGHGVSMNARGGSRPLCFYCGGTGVYVQRDRR